ncbi:macrophage migration inhibitory factor-like [Lineus longissimus]|uniref:macrophage migration inhibitory factor-like n=1 Tax=Lineus longissimus TaxID=88925 RepID=UPI00315D6FE9
MPILTIKTNVKASEVPEGFHEETTTLLAQVLKKPVENIFVILETDVNMTFGGKRTLCAVLTLGSVGMFSPSHTPAEEITKGLGPHIRSKLGIEKDRYFILYDDRKIESIGMNV